MVNAILLLGPQSHAKAVLGHYLASQQPSSSRFVVLAEEEGRSETNADDLGPQLEEHFRWAQAEGARSATASPSAPTHAAAPLLVLDCVWDLRGGFELLSALRAHGVRLLQVLYLPSNITESQHASLVQASKDAYQAYKEKPNAAPDSQCSQRRNERWMASASRLIELFTSLGIMTEISTTATQYSYSYSGGGPRHSLVALGYDAGPAWTGDDTGVPPPSDSAVAEHAHKRPRQEQPGKPPPEWLRAAGGRLPTALTATPLRLVTCPAAELGGDGCGLVTCGEERRGVLAAAEQVLGLKGLGEVGEPGAATASTATHFLEPASRVRSAADVRWVAWPGRYAARRRWADGVRYLLLALGPQLGGTVKQREEGAAGATVQPPGASGTIESCSSKDGTDKPHEVSRVYLLNPAGALYACQATVEQKAGRGGGGGGSGGLGGSLPAGTVLDREVVWRERRAFFLAFDALSVAGRRLWQLELPDRLAPLGPEPDREADAKGSAGDREGGAGDSKRSAGSGKHGAGGSKGRSDGGARGRKGRGDGRAGGSKGRGNGGAACRYLGLVSEDGIEPLQRAEAGPGASARAYTPSLGMRGALPCCPPPLPANTAASSSTDASANPVLTVFRAACADVSQAEISALASGGAHGIVFTPYSVPYALLTPELLYEWTPARRAYDRFVARGQAVSDLKKGRYSSEWGQLLPELMYECRPGDPTRAAQDPATYQPVAVRWDLPYGVPARPSTWVAMAVAFKHGRYGGDPYREYSSQATRYKRLGRFSDAASLEGAVRCAQDVASRIISGQPVTVERWMLRRSPQQGGEASASAATVIPSDVAALGGGSGGAGAGGSSGVQAGGVAQGDSAPRMPAEAVAALVKLLGRGWTPHSQAAAMRYKHLSRALDAEVAAGAVERARWSGGLRCYTWCEGASALLPKEHVVLHPASKTLVAVAWLEPREAEAEGDELSCQAEASTDQDSLRARWRHQAPRFRRSLPVIRASLLPDDEAQPCALFNSTPDSDSDLSESAREPSHRQLSQMDSQEHEDHEKWEEMEERRSERKERRLRLYDSLSEDEARECAEQAGNQDGAGSARVQPKKKAATRKDVVEAEPCSVAAGLVDGWPVMAFLWKGELFVSAEGDLDAPEALWAADWLERHADLTAFQPHWTYELRAVYDSAPRVVPYAFEGVVLAAAVKPCGSVLPPAALPMLAARLGLTGAVPYFVGPSKDFRGRLPGQEEMSYWWVRHRPPGLRGPRSEAVCPPQPAPPQPSLRYKGWLMETFHTKSGKGASSSQQDDTVRFILLALSCSSVSYAAHMLHPLAVWDRLCFGGASRTGLADGLPPHLRTELSSQLDAWEGAWTAVRHEAAEALAAARDGGVLTQLAGLSSQLATAVWAAEEQAAEAGGVAPGGAPAGAASAAAGQAGSPRGEAAGSGSGGTSSQAPAGAAGLPASAGAGPLPAIPAGAGEAGGAGAGAGAGRSQCPVARAGELLRQARAAGGGEAHAASAHETHPAFLAALACAASRWNARPQGELAAVLPPSLYRGERTRHVSEAKIHQQLLLALRPAWDGSGLPGYAPSPAFEQLWASGWAGGPEVGRMAAQPPAPMSQLLDELLERCLAPLEGRDLVAALCVCRRWRRVLQRSGPGAAAAAGAAAGAGGGGGRSLARRLQAGRLEAERREEEWRDCCRENREQAIADDDMAAAYEMEMEDDYDFDDYYGGF
ncbi:hypothetical protein HYH03_007653 [Edaphochlamys debaryana]|uniref:F-box domain-containing protein n=1 Tax=Edaphochlamys debaryana TaxID=47281 RepID=A0A835Y8E1_9CHLO|nr:hypothetical protein HYH03_007653 [Edaphochlamys debaryana]|eukprot:KAG2494300.1 hypothetical protein HYH03_007653 [Edaphochlamys debaryana]